MLCDNCGENEANIKYTQIINGVKKEMNLCEKCGEELGVTDMQFDMPINFSNFLGDFLTDLDEDTFLPSYNKTRDIRCNICGSNFDDIINTGKFGCSNCYDVFQDRIDEIIRKIQGSTKHIGRLGKEIKSSHTPNNVKEANKKEDKQQEKKEKSQVEVLQDQLKSAIKEERYEDAAKLRDQINELKNK